MQKRRKNSIFERKDSFDYADKKQQKIEMEKKKKQTLKMSLDNAKDIEEAKEHNDNLYFKEREMVNDEDIEKESKNILNQM